MPAWKDRLKDEEIWATVGYIQSLANASGDPGPVVSATPSSAAAAFAGPPEAARGRDLFFAADRCASCHALGGRGTAVGPDVSKVAAEQLLAAIRSSRSRIVRTVKLKDGETFPAVMGAEDGGFVQVFDLTSAPPVRRTLEKSEVQSSAQAEWSHQSVAMGYTPEQLADIVAYIRWTASAGR